MGKGWAEKEGRESQKELNLNWPVANQLHAAQSESLTGIHLNVFSCGCKRNSACVNWNMPWCRLSLPQLLEIYLVIDLDTKSGRSITTSISCLVIKNSRHCCKCWGYRDKQNRQSLALVDYRFWCLTWGGVGKGGGM